jgi:hypothetical protein
VSRSSTIGSSSRAALPRVAPIRRGGPFMSATVKEPGQDTDWDAVAEMLRVSVGRIHERSAATDMRHPRCARCAPSLRA